MKSYSNYSIQYHPDSKLLQVSCSFYFEACFKIKLMLPIWRPGRYIQGNFSKNVLQLKELSAFKWKERVNKNETIYHFENPVETFEIEYLYYAADYNAGATFSGHDRLIINPVNCLFYLSDLLFKPAELQVIIPQHYSTATSLLKNENELFVADSVELLFDSPIIASPYLKQKSFTLENSSIYVVLNHPELEIPDTFIQDVKTACKSCFDVFGNLPFDTYYFLIESPDFQYYHGVEHLHATVIVLGEAKALFGSLYTELLGILTHEFFHVWNIKTIRPIEMLPYRFNEENYSYSGFVYEGITTYFGDYLNFTSGLITENEWLDILKKTIQRHVDNPGRWNMSLADASFETWVDGYDQATPARKVSIYNEGFLIAWMIDMRLRLISDGNLSHLMYVFNKRFGNLQKGYHTRTLFDLIKELYAVSLDSIFEKFILKKACYFEEIRNLANNFGLTITLEKASFSARYLGFKINETEKGFFVLQVYPESLADRFGIKPGIEISHCNNLVIQDLLQTEFYPTTHFSIIFSPNKEIQFDLDSLQKTYFEMVEVKKKEVE